MRNINEYDVLIGERLKEQRVARKMSLADVSKNLMMRSGSTNKLTSPTIWIYILMSILKQFIGHLQTKKKTSFGRGWLNISLMVS